MSARVFTLAALVVLAGWPARAELRPATALYACCVEYGVPGVTPRPLPEQAALLHEIGSRGPIGLMCFGVPGDARDHLARSMRVCRSWHAPPATDGYVVVVSKATAGDPEWAAVVDALVERHGAAVVRVAGGPAEALPELRRHRPRYLCFVARPEEAGREYVRTVHRVVRSIDGDPFADAYWGILTGYDAANALAIARTDEPLIVRMVGAGTQLALEMCEAGFCFDELKAGFAREKHPGEPPRATTVPTDTTQPIVDLINSGTLDLFVSSGHATERDWQIGFRYPNGQLISRAGQLIGRDTDGRLHPVDSPNPKVYLAVGNCLMAHIDGPDAMALAWLNSAGVRQLVGYTVPTWFGYGGWGLLDFFLEQPGRFTLAEAYLANQHALVWEHLRQPQSNGHHFDLEVVVLFGDPGWAARMADGPRAWEQTLTEADGVWTFTIHPNRGAASFDTICDNGSQRGGRPMIQFFPRRLVPGRILEGAEWNPVLADDFLLFPHPGPCDPARAYRVVFEADDAPAAAAD